MDDFGRSPFLQNFFDQNGELVFDGQWEVLMGQSEVINWLRTTPNKFASMRYAGEWKLAGGNVDAGETIAHAAARELQEEFLEPLGFKLPKTAVLRPFTVKQTRAVRSRSNLMHCFIALEDENPWLRDLSVERMNSSLELRREKFRQLVGTIARPSAQFWSLPMSDRERVTPEVYQVSWIPLRDAVRNSLSSMAPGTFVNDYQKNTFQSYGKKRRDPMFITAALLNELSAFPDSASVVAHCESVDLATLRRGEQWLFAGMDATQVAEAFEQRQMDGGGVNPSFKSAATIARLRQQRSALVARL